MSWADRVLCPEIDNCTTGESAIGSENVAVMVRDVPDLTGWAMEYVMEAEGAVLSNVTDEESDTAVTGVPGFPSKSVNAMLKVTSPSVSFEAVVICCPVIARRIGVSD